MIVHIASKLWRPVSLHGQDVQAFLSLDTLAMAAICFFASVLFVHESRRGVVHHVAWLTASTMLCLGLLIFGPPRTWIICGLLVSQHGGILVASFKSLPGRPAILRVLTTTNALGLLWMLSALWIGRVDMLVPAILAELFASAAVGFWSEFDRHRGFGVGTTCVGLLFWSALFPATVLVRHFWPGASIASEVWILPMLCTAFGMILIMLEESASAADASTKEYRRLFETNPHPLLIFDVHTLEILSVNQAALDKHGYSRKEFLLLKLSDLIDPSLAQDVLQGIAASRVKTNHASRHVRKDGSFLPIDITAYDIVFQGRRCRFLMAIDVTEREVLHQELVQQARRDALTGLPNRLCFKEQLTEAVSKAMEKQEKLAILCLKIDRFKRVNETHGPHIGDACLTLIANLLSSHSRATDLIARTGGNEFAVVLTGLKSFVTAESFAKRLLDSLSEPLLAGGCKLHISFSIGIAVCPGDGTTVMQLWRGAESALQNAQDAGGARTIWLSAELTSASEERIELEAFLRIQIEEGGFYLAYQPIYGFDGEVHGLEALLRLNHPVYGPVSPAKFIPIAEETGLILPIGDWVIEEVCRQLTEWKEQGVHLVPVALNVSGLQFMDRSFVDRLMSIMRSHNIDPHLIALEITESTAMLDVKEVSTQMESLSARGIRFSIDDFGTGHSSLGRLDQLPLSVLKIDRSFTERLGCPHGTNSIVRAIIGLAKTLDITVVAEGVETEEQIDTLRELGCDRLQGFLLSRPVQPQLIPTLLDCVHPMFTAVATSAAATPARRHVTAAGTRNSRG
jgi:diguanylate cyclase (GGDEF)-like protein/PAS domain S-box-containing protein